MHRLVLYNYPGLLHPNQTGHRYAETEASGRLHQLKAQYSTMPQYTLNVCHTSTRRNADYTDCVHCQEEN